MSPPQPLLESGVPEPAWQGQKFPKRTPTTTTTMPTPSSAQWVSGRRSRCRLLRERPPGIRSSKTQIPAPLPTAAPLHLQWPSFPQRRVPTPALKSGTAGCWGCPRHKFRPREAPWGRAHPLRRRERGFLSSGLSPGRPSQPPTPPPPPQSVLVGRKETKRAAVMRARVAPGRAAGAGAQWGGSGQPWGSPQ
ncbi:hypothetical protein P7K49_027583 [Saguinus oedipus]|uniref:Uncharacterized protein n=1 Tax=Saguinus oedipus TaxID=9490 RepID=A0ABQ9UA03_SAGOE|nr:hypothetical protein P7K49_027583 [Saguinus oedipus]